MKFDVVIPETKRKLLKTIREYTGKNFRFAAGCTDLLMELKDQPDGDLMVINLARLDDERFATINKERSGIRLGAGVSVAALIGNELIQKQFPVLYEAARLMASPQIRQVATVGGNLCTASPAGDIACALTSLSCECEILSPEIKFRSIPIEYFFVNVRKTALAEGEILYSVFIPFDSKESVKTHSGFIKIGTRRSMECAVVSLAYHLQLDKLNRIKQAGIAIGSAAPTVKFARSACEYLFEKSLHSFSEAQREEFAQRVISYAQPISDIRGSAWYRKEVLFNISKSILEC